MKGHRIARIDVTDEEVYPEYGKRAMPAIAKYGSRLIVRGGRATTREGRDYARNVVIEFDSYGQALACYDSPEYQESLIRYRILGSVRGRGMAGYGYKRAFGRRVLNVWKWPKNGHQRRKPNAQPSRLL